MPSRQQWLRQARQILSETFGPQSGPIRVTIKNAAGESVSLTAVGDAAPASSQTASPLEAAILQVLRSGHTIPPKQLASKAGYAYGPRFRSVMADLSRRGAVVRTPDGYRQGQVSRDK